MASGPTHDRQGKRRREWAGRGVKRPGYFNAEPPKTERHDGIIRNPREPLAPNMPLSERHKQVLALVLPTPTSATAIARNLEISPNSSNSALYALRARGLVERLPGKGWVRT